MKLAESMKDTTRNIMASYNQRAQAVGDIVDGTRANLKGFARDRQKLNKEQSQALGEFTGELARNIEGMLKGIQADIKKMGHAREVLAKELNSRLAKEAREIKNYTDKKLKEYGDDRGAMSQALKKELVLSVKDTVSAVKTILGNADALIGEYRADMKKSAGAWSSMAATLAHARKKGIVPSIEMGGDALSVEEAVEKKHKKKEKEEEGGAE